MSASLYYSAKRNFPLSSAEYIRIQSIIKKFNRDFPYKNEEMLSFYQHPSSEYIIEGATKLAVHDENVLITSVNYWLSALSQLRVVLPSAEWDVSVEHYSAAWVKDQWEMPF